MSLKIRWLPPNLMQIWWLIIFFHFPRYNQNFRQNHISYCIILLVYHILSHYICTAHTCTKSLLYDNISRMLRIYIYTVYTLRQSNMAMDTPFMNDFLNETSIYTGISVAKFDFQRVSTSKLPFLGYTLDTPNHWISHYGWFLGTPMA